MGKCGWWYLKRISADSGMQFTSTEFQDEYQTRGVWITLAAPEHQKMNGQVKVTQRMLRTNAHSLMVHARVLEAYINFALMYMAYHILLVIPIKDLIKEDSEPTIPFKLATSTKPSISNLHVLFSPSVVQKSTAYVRTKALTMYHQAQKGFHGIFVVIPQHQKWYILYVTHKRKIVSSYDVVFDEIYIVRWHTRQNHINKQWICEPWCHTYHMLHLQRKKLAI